MKKYKLLDLYCCAGGAGMGYNMAGFEVTGVDIKKQPRYPFEFIQGDAINYLLNNYHKYDAVHASPPCQRYSNGAKQMGTTLNFPDLIKPTRDAILTTKMPYIIENIVPAKKELIKPFMLCGTYFNLGVFRHRLFETNFYVLEPKHSKHLGKIGDGKYSTVTGHAGGSSKRDGFKNGSTEDWKIAMGINWATGDELRESIPPAYTKYIGEYLLKNIMGINEMPIIENKQLNIF